MMHSDTVNHDQTWPSFAAQILEVLSERSYEKWSHTDWHGAPIEPLTTKTPANTAPIKKMDGCANPKAMPTHYQDDMDSILDEIEMDWDETIGAILPPCPEHQKRPRAEIVMMAVRIAKRFTTQQALSETFCHPGHIAFLRCPTDHSVELMTNTLRAMFARGALVDGSYRPDARQVSEVFFDIEACEKCLRLRDG